mgnify:FL=1
MFTNFSWKRFDWYGNTIPVIEKEIIVVYELNIKKKGIQIGFKEYVKYL